MGDARYQRHYEKVRAAIDRISQIEQMTDDELVQALGAASRDRDPYLANVLTTAVLNRTRRGRAVIETIGDGVCVVDREGLITFANPAASEILGWTMSELQGTQFHAIVHHHLGSYHEQVTDCALAGVLDARAVTSRIEDVFSPRDGLPIEVACTISSIAVDGLADSSVVLFQDIRERKREQSLLAAQARVLESAVEKTVAELGERERVERRLEGVLAALPDAVVVTDALGAIALANGAAERMFGYAAGELVGQAATVLLPESNRAPGEGGRGSTFLTSLPTDSPASVQALGRRKDRTEFPIEATTSIFEETPGPSVVTRIRDVTARRLREEAMEDMKRKLRAAADKLERHVAARTESLTRSYHELEAFSYSVSHDLQAPLRAIEFLLSSALEDYGPGNAPLKRDLERVKREIERLRAMVVAVLQLAKLGAEPVEAATVDISALATRVCDDAKRMNPTRLVETTIQPGMSAVADPALLRTLLENLLSNAWKYSEGRSPAHVEVGVKPSTPPTFFVRDDGEGFEMRQVARLFHPFTRLASAGTKEGTGIGLASARRVVEGHGGRIWAESAPGQGATFFFTLAPEAPG